MPFSYSAVWDDTTALFRANASVILAVAGAFVFLPNLLVTLLLPVPRLETDNPLPVLTEYYTANFHWFLLASLVSMLAFVTILLIFFDGRSSTVGATIGRALLLLPFYVLAWLLGSILILLSMLPILLIAGLLQLRAVELLAVIPAVYLIGRLSPLGPCVVAEDRRNPIGAIMRSFGLTKGKGWSIAGLMLLVFVAAVVIMMASAALGALFILLLGPEGGALLSAFLNCAISSAIVVLFVVLSAAIYRALGERGSVAAD